VGDAVQVAAAKVKEAAAQPDGAQAKGLMGDLGSMFGAIALQVRAWCLFLLHFFCART
jgi:hypothetical protein